MKVKQLIKALKNMPPNAHVMHIWDGEARTGIENVWLAKNGTVVTSDFNMACYSEESIPFDAKLNKSGYWVSPDE